MSVKLSEIGGLGTPQATRVYRSAAVSQRQNVGPMYADARMTAGVYKAPKPPPPKITPPISLDVLSRLSFADISSLADAAVKGQGWSKGAASFTAEQVKVSVSNITVAYNAAAEKARIEEERKKAREEQTAKIVGAVKSSAEKTAQAIRGDKMSGVKLSEISGPELGDMYEEFSGLGRNGGMRKKGQPSKPNIFKRAAASVGQKVIATNKAKAAATKNIIATQQAFAKKLLPKALANKMIATQNKILASGKRPAPLAAKVPLPVLKKAAAAVTTATAQAKMGLQSSGTNQSAAVVKKAAVVATKAITSPQAAAVNGGQVAVAKEIAKALPFGEGDRVVKAAEAAQGIKQAAAGASPAVKAEATKTADAIVAQAVEKATEKKVEEAVKSAPSPEVAEAQADSIESPVEANDAIAEKKAAAVEQAAAAQETKEAMEQQPAATEVAPSPVLPAPEQASDSPEVIEAAPGAREAIVTAQEAEKLPGDDKQQVQEITSANSDDTNITTAAVEDGVDQMQGLGFLKWESGVPFYKQPLYWIGVVAVVGVGYAVWRRSSRPRTFEVTGRQLVKTLRQSSRR